MCSYVVEVADKEILEVPASFLVLKITFFASLGEIEYRSNLICSFLDLILQKKCV